MAVDLTVLTIRDGQLHLLLVERGNPPFKHRLALPGGFVRADEDFDAAAARELREETSVDGLRLEQIGAYGAPARDPRGRVASVVYLSAAPNLPAPRAGTDAAAAQWVPLSAVRHLAFDHDTIVAAAVEFIREKVERTPVTLDFCADTFTIDELRGVFEVFWGIAVDPRRFQRAAAAAERFIRPAGGVSSRWSGRRLGTYTRGDATVLHPPIQRASVAADRTP